jgi:DNA polymerase epsilon subunit 2
VLGTAESRIMAIRDRLNIIKQTILRNEHFAPATIPSRDREHLLTASQINWFNLFFLLAEAEI